MIVVPLTYLQELVGGSPSSDFSCSPIDRTRDPLEAWRKPFIPHLTRVVEREDQAVVDDRLVVGILPVCSGWDDISIARGVHHVGLYSLTVLRLEAIPTVALTPRSVMLR